MTTSILKQIIDKAFEISVNAYNNEYHADGDVSLETRTCKKLLACLSNAITEIMEYNYGDGSSAV